MFCRITTFFVLAMLASPVVANNDITFGLGGDPEPVAFASEPELFGLDSPSGLASPAPVFESVLVGYETQTVCEHGVCRQVQVPVYERRRLFSVMRGSKETVKV